MWTKQSYCIQKKLYHIAQIMYRFSKFVKYKIILFLRENCVAYNKQHLLQTQNFTNLRSLIDSVPLKLRRMSSRIHDQ